MDGVSAAQQINSFFGSIRKNRINNDFDELLFVFLFKFGVDYNSFVKLPVPYILSMVELYSDYLSKVNKKT